MLFWTHTKLPSDTLISCSSTCWMLKASKLNGTHANELLRCPLTTMHFYVGLQQCIRVSNIRCYVKTHFTFTADRKILRLTSPDWRFFPRIKSYSTNIPPPYSRSRHRFRIVWLTYPLVSCKYIFVSFDDVFGIAQSVIHTSHVWASVLLYISEESITTRLLSPFRY